MPLKRPPQRPHAPPSRAQQLLSSPGPWLPRPPSARPGPWPWLPRPPSAQPGPWPWLQRPPSARPEPWPSPPPRPRRGWGPSALPPRPPSEALLARPTSPHSPSPSPPRRPRFWPPSPPPRPPSASLMPLATGRRGRRPAGRSGQPLTGLSAVTRGAATGRRTGTIGTTPSPPASCRWGRGRRRCLTSPFVGRCRGRRPRGQRLPRGRLGPTRRLRGRRRLPRLDRWREPYC